MQLNRAVSMRLMELLSEKNMTQYQLSTKSGLPRSTVSNIINCTYPSMKLRIVHELCQGLEIGINAFLIPHYLMKQILNHNAVWKGYHLNGAVSVFRAPDGRIKKQAEKPPAIIRYALSSCCGHREFCEPPDGLV